MTAGTKKIPGRAAAKREAMKDIPMVCVIMLFIITHPERGKATHCIRRATVPMAITCKSSFRTTEKREPAKRKPEMPKKISTKVDTITQNQKASLTRLNFCAP